MIVTLTKRAILKLKEGQPVELDMISGGKPVKFLLMRESAWEMKKKQIEKNKSN